MNHFERLMASPEVLGEFLSGLPLLQGPWNDAFQQTFCRSCHAENCDAENCPHREERDNPTWWLGLDAVSEQREKGAEK